MQNLRINFYLIFLFMFSSMYSMENKHKKLHLLKVEAEKKLCHKRLLQKDVERIRLYKTRKEFSEALIAGDLKKVGMVLYSCRHRININEPIDYRNTSGDIVKVFPLVLAAAIHSDLAIVKFLISEGAEISVSNSSLIYCMLLNFNCDESLWMHTNKMMRNKYLAILHYLFKYVHFDIKNEEDREKYFEIWDEIIKRVVKEGTWLGKKTLKTISKIAFGFLGSEQLIKEFKDALIESDVERIECLLHLGLDINQPIEYESSTMVIYELPVVTAAAVCFDLQIVELLLEHGARIDFSDGVVTAFSDGSLIYYMLEFCRDEQSFWENNKDIDKVLHKYLVVLRYLLEYSCFTMNKDTDSQKCAALWSQIEHKVHEEYTNWSEKSLRLVKEISDKFFPIL